MATPPSTDWRKSCGGAFSEGDVFSVLKHSPFAIRAFEFATADGALDCSSRGFSPDTSYADRWWEVDQCSLLTHTKRHLLLFDVKSRASPYAGSQSFIASASQREEAAFFIGICSANPDYVELIPNLHQGQQPPMEEKRDLSINVSRESKLFPPAYGSLDPCGGPYRMPLALLLEAVRRVRVAARGGGPYINPWTLVSFPDWNPQTTTSSRSLKPVESSQHYTGLLCMLEVYRSLRVCFPKGEAVLDFVGLAPRLADFKVIERTTGRQSLVQHKLESHERALSSTMDKVAIARRTEAGEARWYFSATERFDFLFYKFSFSNRPGPQPIYDLFFIPERDIPTDFYTTTAEEVGFDIDAFRPYRIRMDQDRQWVQRIMDIIAENPRPRHPSPRPRRVFPPGPAGAASQTSTPDTAPQPFPSEPDAILQLNSIYARYRAILIRSHRVFFEKVMMQCMTRKSGLLVVLAADHPTGDFAFCRYSWTQEECDAFAEKSIPPQTVASLPALTPLVPLYLCVKEQECYDGGPVPTVTQFRRLNALADSRLLIWDLWGIDCQTQLDHPLLFVPTEDIRPTEDQRGLFASQEIARLEKPQLVGKSALLSHMLSSGKIMADYMVGSSGPSIYGAEGLVWVKMWESLMLFTNLGMVEHPPGLKRRASKYRQTLSSLHRALLDQYRRG